MAVVTREDAPSGRGRKLKPSPIKQLALDNAIRVLDPPKPRGEAFLQALAATKPDLGIVVAYGRILPRDVLHLPKFGCINAHGSLLPGLRGAAPIERAILAGHPQTGVTIMQMDEGMDTGPMLSSASVTIDDQRDAGELRETLAALSASMFVDAIASIDRGSAQPVPQDEQLASYAPPLRRQESRIDWWRDAVDVGRVIRAFAPAPGAFSFDGGRRLKILKAQSTTSESRNQRAGTVLGHESHGVRVACGRGEISLETVQPEGKRPMPATDYARGTDALVVGRILGETT